LTAEPLARNVNLDAIRDAARHIYDVVVRTPLVRLDVPADWGSIFPHAPAELWLKLETLQPVGSFKIRGAHNAVRSLPADVRSRGVWTVSAGNAAQGVALAARAANTSCTVLIPETAPETKRAALARLGAEMRVTTYLECWRAAERHEFPGMPGTLVHPFDDDAFICGNGTVALEILEDLPRVETIVASCGGGGLLAGIACAARSLHPDVRIVAAEPETAAPLAHSLALGAPAAFDAWQPSFVDGAGGRSVLPSMWPLLKDRIETSLVMPLEQVRAAMRLVAEQLHVVIEGAAGVAVAAALSGRAGRGSVVAVASGGNIDLPRFVTLLEGVGSPAHCS
jgi:threonine dehydratase